MGKRAKKPEEKLNEIIMELQKSHDHWKDINENGCNDPAWPDGTNMNLVRNHIIYYRKQIEDLCAEIGTAFPTEYYFPIPPEVDSGYMANLLQEKRVQRLLQFGERLTMNKTAFDDTQLCFA